MACQVENSLDEGFGIRVETVGGHRRDTPVGEFPQLSMYYLPVLCMHCDQPPCLDACPIEAIYQRDDGIVLVDEGRCNGCQVCLEACPYDALIYELEKDKVWKCTLCAPRVAQGLWPFCALCCEMEAISFGDLADPSSQVSNLRYQREAYVLQPELGIRPAIYYCPPKGGRVEGMA